MANARPPQSALDLHKDIFDPDQRPSLGEIAIANASHYA
jgi:hypothetical protein